MARISAFSQRVANQRNSLPNGVVKAESLNKFRNGLYEFWSDEFWYEMFWAPSEDTSRPGMHGTLRCQINKQGSHLKVGESKINRGGGA